MKLNKYFILFTNCILVNGYSYCVLCDLTRNDIYNFPKNLYKILKESRVKKIGEILRSLKIDKNEWSYYEQFMLSNDLGFYTDSVELFPELSSEWHSPFEVTNIIIDVIKDDNLNFEYYRLNEIKCHTLQIRIFNNLIDFERISEFLELLKTSHILSIEILLPFSDKFYPLSSLEEMCLNFPRINFIIVYGSNSNINHCMHKNTAGKILFTKDLITNHKNCGVVNQSYFVSNIPLFMESQKYNSCLNRKISIDAEGNIKNCPSMTESFGNIKDTTLAEAIEKPGFKKYWDINKDKIHVCKDCEFRYICTDCRAYVEDPADILSKPLKCGYNPYTGEWSEWSTNPLKQKAIDLYGMREMVEEMNTKTAEE
jgi:SPASM domain peptide maturase of grasp-with-spasm system